MQATILLLKSEPFNWLGLEAAVRELPGFHLLDAVSRVADAVEMAKIHGPTIMLLAAVIDNQPMTSQIASLHAASPASKIIESQPEVDGRRSRLSERNGDKL